VALFADRYVYFENKSRQEGRQGLLWPAYAWKVLFPSEQQRLGANLFQEAILGLLRAGERDVMQLSGLLSLDPELVRYIIATQLQPNGWVDERMKVSPDGERLLDDAEDLRLDLTLGYAFQDAVSGAWFPRFVTSMPEVRPHAFDARGRPAFLLDRERGWIDRPFVLSPAIARPVLEVGALTEAYRAYRKDIASAARRGQLEGGVDFQAIEAIDSQPTPVYLWCELYRDESEPQPWLVSDPFRLRKAAAWLRKPLLVLAPSNRGLVQRMQRLTGAQDTELSAEEWLRQVEGSAQLAAWSDYPFVMSQPLVSEHLMRLLRQRAKVQTQSRVNNEDVGLLAGESYNLIEAVLKWMLVRWSCDTSAWPKTQWRRDQARQEFNSLRLAAVSPQLVEQLAGQQPRMIAGAINSQSGSFKALLAGAVFCAAVHPDHPLHSVPAASLQLDRLAPLADFRNVASGHASGVKVTLADAQDRSRFAIEWMALFQTWY
jgi:hypothetical protein